MSMVRRHCVVLAVEGALVRCMQEREGTVNETVRKAEAWNFWYDPRFGSICWPLSAGLAVYESRLYWAVFSAFWTGVSIQRWLGR